MDQTPDLVGGWGGGVQEGERAIYVSNDKGGIKGETVAPLTEKKLHVSLFVNHDSEQMSCTAWRKTAGHGAAAAAPGSMHLISCLTPSQTTVTHDEHMQTSLIRMSEHQVEKVQKVYSEETLKTQRHKTFRKNPNVKTKKVFFLSLNSPV